MQRLGRNHGGYHGERLDLATTLASIHRAALAHGWTTTNLCADNGVELLVCVRETENARARVYLSTGIHGDEPAGPLALERLLAENAWPADVSLWLCPALNPTGLARNARENAAGLDLNRQYLEPAAPETRAHVAWLRAQPPFELTLCLHEDWEAGGFYLYELNPDGRPSLAEEMIRAVGAACPIDPAEVIEGRPARGGIIRPDIDPRSRPQWPEAFYLLQHKTRLSYTLEAPSDFPLAVRVAALTAAVRAALSTISGGSGARR